MGKRSTPPTKQQPEVAQDDAAALFRAAIGPVRELPATPAPPRKPPPTARSRRVVHAHSEAPAQAHQNLKADALETGDVLRYRIDTVPPRVLQRLRRGQYPVEDEIDLHHSDATQAAALLRHFFDDCLAMGLGCVRVVHGKGLHSETSVPVLKNLVDRMLRQRPEVLAFHSAPPAQGGNGAVLILFRR